MTRLASAFAAALALSCLASPASAALVSQWDFAGSLVWSTAPGDVTFSSGNGSQRVTSDVISWGRSCTGDANSTSCRAWSADGTTVSTNERSGLRITDSLTAGTVFTNGAPVPTSTITHYNRSISTNFALLTGATLLAELSLTPDTPEPGEPGTIDFPANVFSISFVETLNTPGCESWSDSTCDDVFLLLAGDLVTQFTYGDHLYTVQIVAAGLGPLSEGACAAAGAAAGCVGLQTQEGVANPVTFGFSISARLLSVPEPAALALLGLGLTGLGLSRRRR